MVSCRTIIQAAPYLNLTFKTFSTDVLRRRTCLLKFSCFWRSNLQSRKVFHKGMALDFLAGCVGGKNMSKNTCFSDNF